VRELALRWWTVNTYPAPSEGRVFATVRSGVPAYVAVLSSKSGWAMKMAFFAKSLRITETRFLHGRPDTTGLGPGRPLGL
jgi:hypothetical protein